MITKKAFNEGELLDLMKKLERAAPTEYGDVEAFLEADQDIEMKSPFIGLLKAAWNSHIRSVRNRKFKELRLMGLGTTGKPKSTIAEFEKLCNHLENSDRYFDEQGEEKSYHNATSEAILSFGWDYKTCRSTKQFTTEQEENFLKDMKALPEPQMSDGQKTRLKIMARDCLSWLKQSQANRGANNGGV